MNPSVKRSAVLAGVIILTTAFAFPPIVATPGDSLCGTVTAVRAADLITLDYGTGSYVVRIAGVAIERDSARGRQATQYMTTLLLGKFVRLRFDGRNDNGEMVGRIWIDDPERPGRAVRDAGLDLVRAGLARRQAEYTGYKYREMERAEVEARRLKRGFWR